MNTKEIPFDIDIALAHPERVRRSAVPDARAQKIWFYPEGPEEVQVAVHWEGNECINAYPLLGANRYGDRLYLTPDPAARTPWTMKDVPPVCWVRNMSNHNIEWLVRSINTNGVGVAQDPVGTISSWRWMSNNMEFSTDRRTWKPCTKEALAQ